MQLKPEQERVSSLLKETITLMCKNGLKFETKFAIDAVIGITLDEKEVFLISVNEIFSAEKTGAVAENSSDCSDGETSDVHRRKRRRKNRCIKKENASDAESDSQHESANNDSNDDNSIMFIKEEPQTSWPTSSCNYQDQNAADQMNEMKFSAYPETDLSHEASDVSFVNASLLSSGGNQASLCQGAALSQSSATYLTAAANQTSISRIAGADHMQGPNQISQFRIKSPVQVKHRPTAPDGSGSMSPPAGTQPTVVHRHPVSVRAKHDRHCNLCGKRFTSQYGYQVHLKRHQGIHPYTCEVCGKGMSSKTNYDEHMRHHTGNLLHCGNCSRSFITHRSYRSHMLSCK